MKRSTMVLLLTIGGLITAAQSFAQVNILIIGSTKDSGEMHPANVWWSDKKAPHVPNSIPFLPTEIGTQLQNILAQDGRGTVNVTVLDRYRTDAIAELPGWSAHSYNLATWFHYPYPAGSESNRWANLRGEAGTNWNYVVLIGDPYTMEYTPGMYALGVATIAKEAAKGGAETILLMPWPGSGSSSSTNHYKEVVYRTARSSGFKVAPAGLAWAAIKGSARTNPNPDNDGAYIAASSIYSCIYTQSAAASGYVYNDSDANTTFTTYTNNNTASHYAGTFSFQNPYRILDDKMRHVRMSERGTSTEEGFKGKIRSAMDRCKVTYAEYNDTYTNNTPTATVWTTNPMPISFNYGRDGFYSEPEKSYVINPSYWQLGFGYYYQNGNTGGWSAQTLSDIHIGLMQEQDNDLANRMINETPTARNILTRSLWAQIHQAYPTLSPMRDTVHLSYNLDEAVGSYIYTIYSGRCPLDPKLATDADDIVWTCRKIGYETAWRVGRCQSRAPGFKVTPSATSKKSIVPSEKETMRVEFILPPKQNVTVNISVSNTNEAIVGSKQLEFTPQNYNIPQYVVVAGLHGSAASSTFNVVFSTASTDEACNGVGDAWEYTVNRSAPVALTRVEKGNLPVTANQNLPVTISLNTPGATSANTVLAGPSRGTTAWSGTNVVYTPGSDFLGKDGFSFATTNAGNLSVGYIEITVTNAVPNGMVSYRGNGAEGGVVPVETNSYAQSATVTVLGNTGNLTRVGYNFNGWNTATNGSGTSYNASATFAMGTSGAILYAQWLSVPAYTVTYNANASSSGSVPWPQTKTDGVNLALAANIGTLARTGYTYAGWNTAASGTGTTYAVGSIYSVNASVTLYAKWTPNNYTVTFNANGGGTPSPTSKVVTYASTYGTLATVSYPGYTLNGWFTATNGGTRIQEATTVTITANQMLYAQWAAGTSYTVVYHANGADSGAVPVDAGSPYTNGATVTVLGNTGSLARTGYTFSNWNTATNGSGASYTPAATFSISTNTTLYAQWTALPTYTVSFDGNGSTSGSVSNQTKIHSIGLTLSGAGTLVRTGYTFSNWNTQANGLGTSYAAGAIYATDAAVTLYAQWTAVPTYTVSFDGNGSTSGSVSNQTKTHSIGLTLSGADTLVRTGYTFTSWNTQANGLGTSYAAGAIYATDAAVTLYAQWTVSTYTVTYDGNGNTGGTVPSDQTKTYDISLTLASNTGNLTRTGYTFTGWNTAEGATGTHYATGALYTNNGSLALYAQWTANSYSVTFDGNNGTAPSPSSTSVTFGSAYGTLASTSRTNYTFSGWFTAATGGSEVTAATVVTNDSNHTLYAQWLANTYVVSYQGNGNTSGTAPADQAKIHDINLALASNSGNLAKTGHAFIGWNTETNGSGTAYAIGATYSANAALTLHAQWIAGTFLTWDANGTATNQTNGGGAWEGSNLWWTGTGNQNWTSGASAIFGVASTAGGAVTLAAPATVDSLIFNQFSGTYTLGTASNTITLNNGVNKTAASATVSIVSPVTLGGLQTWVNNSTSPLTASSALDNGGHTLAVDGTGTITMSGVISGNGGFVKNGSGRLSFGSSGNANTYAGPTTINGGILSIANNSASLGSGNLTLNGGVLGFYWSSGLTRTLGTSSNQVTIPGGESGFGGDGTSGPTINIGTTIIWGASGQGAATGHFNPGKFVLGSPDTSNAGATTFSTGIDMNGTTRTIVVPKGLSAGGNVSTISGAITSTGTAGLIKEGNGTLILSAANSYPGDTTISGGILRIGNTLNSGNYAGNISVASGATLQIWSSAAQILGGTISGGGGLNKAYGGALTLSGANTYSGRTSFLPQTTAGCTVNITSFNSVNGGTPLVASSSLGAPTTVTNGTIDIGDVGKQAGVTLNYTGPGETTDRVINFGFNGGASQTLNASGSGLLKFTSAMTANAITTQGGKLNLGGTGSGEVTQALPALPSGGLSKNDSGAWTLGGANAYTGPTAIIAGKLFVNGDQSSATGNVSVAANATLGGTGTLGGNTTIAASGKLEFNLGTAAGSHNGLDLASAKALTFSGASVLTITSSGGAATGTYTLVTAPGGITGSAPATLNLPDGWAATVSISTNSLLLDVTQVPSTAYQQWLVEFYGTDSVDDAQITSNGVNTIREAYIIGLNPTNAADQFVLTGNEASSGMGTMVLDWISTSGRVYNLYWSSNMLGGADSFQLLHSNIPWNANSFTNTEHSGLDQGFYRIEVQLE